MTFFERCNYEFNSRYKNKDSPGLLPMIKTIEVKPTEIRTAHYSVNKRYRTQGHGLKTHSLNGFKDLPKPLSPYDSLCQYNLRDKFLKEITTIARRQHRKAEIARLAASLPSISEELPTRKEIVESRKESERRQQRSAEIARLAASLPPMSTKTKLPKIVTDTRVRSTSAMNTAKKGSPKTGKTDSPIPNFSSSSSFPSSEDQATRSTQYLLNCLLQKTGSMTFSPKVLHPSSRVIPVTPSAEQRFQRPISQEKEASQEKQKIAEERLLGHLTPEQLASRKESHQILLKYYQDSLK